MKLKNNKWIFFIAQRFGVVDSRGRSVLTSLLSVLGIAFGVMTLIVILSVMNGFQMGYIESILEASSAHIQVKGTEQELQKIKNLSGLRSFYLFTETQTLMQGTYNRQSGVLLRGIPENLTSTDSGFASTVKMVSGNFDISDENSVILGYELARMLSVKTGDTVSLVAVSGSQESDLFPENADLIVRGLFKTGYYEIDSTFAFVSLAKGQILSGDTLLTAAIKLQNLEKDALFMAQLHNVLPELHSESWRTYNKAFFGALRVEKNMLLILVVLIFVVVTVNIYNGMRRSVFERREEISLLTALGGSSRLVQYVFMVNGLGVGLMGGFVGLLSGLFVSVRINDVFAFAESIVNALNTFFSALILAPADASFSLFSPEYFYMDIIPVRILFLEVLFVFLFGVFSATSAAWLASRAITKLKPAEVLRYE